MTLFNRERLGKAWLGRDPGSAFLGHIPNEVTILLDTRRHPEDSNFLPPEPGKVCPVPPTRRRSRRVAVNLHSANRRLVENLPSHGSLRTAECDDRPSQQYGQEQPCNRFCTPCFQEHPPASRQDKIAQKSHFVNP